MGDFWGVEGKGVWFGGMCVLLSLRGVVVLGWHGLSWRGLSKANL